MTAPRVLGRTLKDRAALTLDHVLPKVAPPAARWWQARRARRARAFSDRLEARINRVLDALIDTAEGPVVQGGPFRGMRYTREACDGSGWCKLAGAYEDELTAAIELLVARAPHTVVNVGAAEGYYAIGLARRLPDARVLAYDVQTKFHPVCRALAELNDVAGRVEVRGGCTTDELRARLRPGALVVMDCEGAEGQLLAADVVPAFEGVDLLVELHPWVDPDIEAKLARRFAATHAGSRLMEMPRVLERYPALARVAPEDRAFAVDEFRPHGQMSWLLFVAERGREGAR